VLRLCLDLNVLIADFLAEAAGRGDTAARTLVRAAVEGRCALGPVQLVVSFGMLDRLEAVLVGKLGVTPATARLRRELVAMIAELGPEDGPALTLGGTGVVPVLDVEDGHVLETALAGRAGWLVTANLRDFTQPSRQRLPVRLAAADLGVVVYPEHRILVVGPGRAAAWLRDPQAHARDTAQLARP
jgi:hypothetical protein